MSSYPRDRNFKTDDTHTASTFDVAEAERQVFARSIYQWQQEYGDETRKSRGERRLSRLSDEGGISSRSLEFEVEQRERKALFSQKEEKQHVAFREAQEARWRCFTNGEAERERTFSTAEHERNLSALEDERQREVLLQVKLEDLRRRSIERGQQLLSNIDTWGSEPLKERESTETMQFQLEEGQRMLNFRCLFI